MDALKRRSRCFCFIGCVVAVAGLSGCQPVDDNYYHSTPSPEQPPPADPDTCECTPVAPFGFFGPSLVGIGPTWQSIQCPAEASLPGFHGLLLDPPQWARECLVTPIPTCSESGWVCAPPPPIGFDFCIYRGEDFTCPDTYPVPRAAFEADGGQLVVDHQVTLCCVAPGPAG